MIPIITHPGTTRDPPRSRRTTFHSISQNKDKRQPNQRQGHGQSRTANRTPNPQRQDHAHRSAAAPLANDTVNFGCHIFLPFCFSHHSSTHVSRPLAARMNKRRTETPARRPIQPANCTHTQHPTPMASTRPCPPLHGFASSPIDSESKQIEFQPVTCQAPTFTNAKSKIGIYDLPCPKGHRSYNHRCDRSPTRGQGPQIMESTWKSMTFQMRRVTHVGAD